MADATPPDPSALLGAIQPPESVDDMRRLLDRFGAFLNAGLPEVGAFHEAVPIADGVRADLVVPRGDGPHPVLVYLHGGGWICGSPASHRKLGYRFAEAGFLVVNVDYRLAPEHPFPVPFEDAIAAIRWAAEAAPRYGGDPARLAVGGDSAGGNLGAAAAAALHGDPARPKAALLIYGVYDMSFPGPSAPEGAGDGGLFAGMPAELGEKLVELMVGSYLGDEDRAARVADPRSSPIHLADRLPPSHLVVGGADPLVVQSRALAERLAEAGIPHELHVDDGMPHGYAQMEFLPATLPAIERMVAFLRKTL